MTRIEKTFSELKAQGKKALIPYVMAGDPIPSVTVPLMHELVANGADIIELGMPFSDPMADGETIALAAERALAEGTSTRHTIEMVKAFRQDNQTTPVILMGYLNPVEFIGYEAFVQQCHEAGVDGLLLVDMPPHEAGELTPLLDKHEMNEIFLLAPTTLPARREKVLKSGSGFIYYVSLKGVTGSANLDTDAVSAQLAEIKQSTDLPVCVGFGIRDGESVKAVGKNADGVIVGSELVKHFAGVNDNDALKEAVSNIAMKMNELRTALDSL